MKRSTEQLKYFYSLAFSLKLRGLLIRVVAFSLFFVILFFNNLMFDWTQMDMVYQVATSIIFALIIPGLFLAISSPLVDVAVAKLYFKAREANGETPYQVKRTHEEIEIAERMKFSGRRKVVLAGSLIATMLFSAVSFIAMVPPVGNPAPVAKVHIEKVPDEQNAWVEYDLAIQDLLEFDSAALSLSKQPANKTVQELIGARSVEISNNKGYARLADAANGFTELTPEHLEFLDRHQSAIKHLLAGAKRPKAQFFTEAPVYSTLVPNLLQTRALATVAVAQARRLAQEGKQREALDLLLATYRFSTDMAEPNSTLISALISVVTRGISDSALFNFMNTNNTDASMDIEIAQKIAAFDQNMATPYQAMMAEQACGERSVEQIYRNNNSKEMEQMTNNSKQNALKVLTMLPGLRIRLLNSYMDVSRRFRESFSEPLKNWDFKTMKQLQDKPVKSFSLNPTDLVSNYIMDIIYANPLAATRSLYHSAVLGKVLQVFASCSAYKKLNGKFPETLEQAMSVANLPVPLDPATGKAIGYRLENGVPVIWLAGVDGTDDGGKDAYAQKDSYSGIAGKDLVFQFGQMPMYFKPSNN